MQSYFEETAVSSTVKHSVLSAQILTLRGGTYGQRRAVAESVDSPCVERNVAFNLCAKLQLSPKC